MASKDLGKIIEALTDQDFTVQVTKRGHFIVRKGGEFVTVFAGTPSDHRSMLNSIAACKRHGFVWPLRR